LQRAAAITWSGPGRHLYQTGWGAAGVGHSLARRKEVRTIYF